MKQDANTSHNFEEELMKWKTLIKAGLVGTLMHGAAQAIGDPNCQWVGFLLDPNRDFEIRVKYSECQTWTTVERRSPLPGPLMIPKKSIITIYQIGDSYGLSSIPLLVVDAAKYTKEPHIGIQCGGQKHQRFCRLGPV